MLALQSYVLRYKVQTSIEWISDGCYDLRKHTIHSQNNNPIWYICIRAHLKLRSKQSHERIHDDYLTELQKVNFTLARPSCNIVTSASLTIAANAAIATGPALLGAPRSFVLNLFSIIS